MPHKNEALRRMTALNLPKSTVGSFYDAGMITCSVSTDDLYFVKNTSIIQDAIDELRRIDSRALPYHAVISRMDIGNATHLLCNLLFVSGYTEDWSYERPRESSNNLVATQCLAYNHSLPAFSDIGMCLFKKIQNGLIRVA